MERHVEDAIDERLRAARPGVAQVPETVFDAELLERVLALPLDAPRMPPRRRRRVVLPAVAVAAGCAVAVLALAGGPGSVGPESAPAAITQALRWFDPPAGTILHFRSELTSDTPGGGRRTLVHETWQSVAQPQRRRTLSSEGGGTLESASGAVYDPATNTIYEGALPTASPDRENTLRTLGRKLAEERAQGGRTLHPDVGAAAKGDGRGRAARPRGLPAARARTPAGDPTVIMVRRLLDRGDATVGGIGTRSGVEARAITLGPGPPGEGAPRWTLWTAVADGRPLELRVDSGPGTRTSQVTRWTSYDVLDDHQSARLLTLRGAHPGARVVRDADQLDAVRRRIAPAGG